MAQSSKLRKAQVESDKATARLQGMKLRAELDPPRAAVGGFPYPARTCAEWGTTKDKTKPRKPKRVIIELLPDVPLSRRKRDAILGSARLLAAILAIAA
jgi:hypothetical protein